MAGSDPMTRVIDGREWRIGGAAEVAWIAQATTFGREITAAIPPIFDAYCTVMLPEGLPDAQTWHDRSVMLLLERNTEPQPRASAGLARK
jgi:hypothetical protein